MYKKFYSLVVLIILGLFGCNNGSGNSNGFINPGTTSSPPPISSRAFVLTIIDGDNKSTYAATGPHLNLAQYYPLIVEVRENGQLVNDINVRFVGTFMPDGTPIGPLGCGQTNSGAGAQSYAKPTLGQAAVIAEPDIVGTVTVTAQVEKDGTSNIVTFTVIGLP